MIRKLLVRYDTSAKTVPLRSIVGQFPNPADGKTYYIKRTLGEPFVFTRDSAITERKINRGFYLYFFAFTAPNGQMATSAPSVIGVEYGEVARAGTLLLKFAAEQERRAKESELFENPLSGVTVTAPDSN